MKSNNRGHTNHSTTKANSLLISGGIMNFRHVSLRTDSQWFSGFRKLSRNAQAKKTINPIPKLAAMRNQL